MATVSPAVSAAPLPVSSGPRDYGARTAVGDRLLPTAPPQERYEIAWRDADGRLQIANPTAPALPLFHAAFAGLGHGAMVQTPDGPVPVEDLWPGDLVETCEDGPQPIVWRGSLGLRAGSEQHSAFDAPPALWRVLAETFGPARPAQDLVLGAGARLVQQHAGAATPLQPRQRLVTIAQLGDSGAVVPITPRGTVQMYSIALARHASLTVAGLRLASYHPCVTLRTSLPQEILAQFLGLFPHIDLPGDFGPLCYPMRDHAGDED